MQQIQRAGCFGLAAISFAIGLAFYAPRERMRDLPAPPESSADRVAPTSELLPPGVSSPGALVAISPDALVTVEISRIPTGYTERGTSFPLGYGLWLTARHVVGNECGNIVLVIDGKNVFPSLKYLAPAADLAVLEVPGSRSHTGLPIEQAAEGNGQHAFAFGFPQGKLGATEDALVGRAKLRLRGHLSGTAPVLAWIETKRYPDNIDSLAGISGGPMIDEAGNVIGIIVAASVRRGLNYTVAPEILREIAGQLGSQFDTLPARDAVARPVSLETSADTLRQASRIAETYCIPQ